MPDRLLMGPGPSNPYPEVTAAFAQPLLGHLDPEFLRILDETCDRLRTVFDLSEIQADYILELPLRRLTRFSRIELEKEKAEAKVALQLKTEGWLLHRISMGKTLKMLMAKSKKHHQLCKNLGLRN